MAPLVGASALLLLASFASILPRMAACDAFRRPIVADQGASIEVVVICRFCCFGFCFCSLWPNCSCVMIGTGCFTGASDQNMCGCISKRTVLLPGAASRGVIVTGPFAALLAAAALDRGECKLFDPVASVRRRAAYGDEDEGEP